jgi:hypothetical protein
MDLSQADNGLVDQADNGRQENLVHLLFHSLRGPSEHDRPANRPSPAPIVRRDRFQSCSKGARRRQALRISPCSPCKEGPEDFFASRLALTELIAVASPCRESRDGDRAIERRVGVRRFGVAGTEIDVFGNFEPLHFEYFLC